MSDGPSPERSKHLSKRDFFKKASAKVGEIAAKGIIAGGVAKYLLTEDNPDIKKSPVIPTPTPIPGLTTKSVESEPIKKPTEVPRTAESTGGINKNEQYADAILSMKKTLEYFPGLLDDNPALKELVGDKSNNLNNRQFRIREIPEHNAKQYELILDRNSPLGSEPDIKFLIQTNRERFDDLLSIEFNVDKSGKIIPQMKAAENEIANDDLKAIVNKMTPFAPKVWADRTIFDEKQNKAVPHGVDGSNDFGQPRSYVQAQPNGHLIFVLFIPSENTLNPPGRPNIIPDKKDVLVI